MKNIELKIENIMRIILDDNSIYIGTDMGPFRSSDYGDSWIGLQVEGKTDNEVIWSILKKDSMVFIGIGRGIYVTYDNGLSWNDITDKEVMFDNNIRCTIYYLTSIDTTIFARIENGKLCLTSNYGISWEKRYRFIGDTMAYGLFTCGNNLFAGSELGVLFSSDFGKNWTIFNEGLRYYDDTYKYDAYQLVLNDKYIFVGSGTWEHDCGIYRAPLSNCGIVTTSVSETVKENILSLSPNPASDFIIINTDKYNNQLTSIEIYNIYGEKVLSKDFEPGSFKNSQSIDISGLYQGIYYCVLTSNKWRIVDKFMVVK